jgi:hypothetical protein
LGGYHKGISEPKVKKFAWGFMQKGMVRTMFFTMLAKGISDFTFGGAFLWYLAKYIVSAVIAFCGIMLGIKLRKKKNDKTAAVKGTGAEQ